MSDNEFWQRQAERKNMSEREYCIMKINEWREKLEDCSEDFRELDEEEFTKKVDAEIRERNNNE